MGETYQSPIFCFIRLTNGGCFKAKIAGTATGPADPDKTQESEKQPKDKEQSQNDRVIDAMSTLFESGATIGTFFAGFTLNIVVSVDANEKPDVRLYAAIGSLLFVLVVLFSFLSSLVFSYYKSDFSDIMKGIHKHQPRFTKDPRWKDWHVWAMFGLLPIFLFGGLMAGVYFFFLVMRAYEPDVAFAGLAVIGVSTVVGGIGWMALLYSYWVDAQKMSGTLP